MQNTEELIKTAWELLSKDDEPLLPGFGMLVDKIFVKSLTDALEEAEKEIERLRREIRERVSDNADTSKMCVELRARAESAERERDELDRILLEYQQKGFMGVIRDAKKGENDG